MILTDILFDDFILDCFSSEPVFPNIIVQLISVTLGVVICYACYLETLSSLEKLIITDYFFAKSPLAYFLLEYSGLFHCLFSKLTHQFYWITEKH